MFKPIHAARSEGKFKSFDELAKRLAEGVPELHWPAVRALAVKVADIDRGDKVWWMKRHAHSLALARLLEVPLVDLGLHEAPPGDMFEFASFPELPPLALARETVCDIGFVDAIGPKQNDENLQFWLDAVPPRHAWRGPEHRISWLKFQPGSGLSFFWAIQCARTRYDHMSVRRLLDAGERLRQPGNLIIRIEQPCEDMDLVALGGAHRDLNLLIVAPFGAPQKDSHAPSTWLPSWDVLTGQTDERVAALIDPDSFWDAIASYEWRLHEDWQARLLDWVEKRIGGATSDTLFTGKGVANWLASFPDGWQFVNGPADLLAICRLCHVSRETALPRVSDSDAGQRLLKRVAGTDNAISRRFTALVAARLKARDLDWNSALTGEQWGTLASEQAGIPDQASLLAIADGPNQSVRRQLAKALSERVLATSTAPLVNARLLVETRNGMLALTPQFLVDLVARDQLMEIIRHEAVEHWAMYCYDAERLPLVDAAMGSLSIGELLPVLDRIKALPRDTLVAIGAAEALFREIGKRICGTATVPNAFACLAELVLPRLHTDGFTPWPWTRSVKDEEESLEWNMTCWAWSLWCEKPPLEIPVTWAWCFPGWVPSLAAVELPYLWPDELPKQAVVSKTWERMMTLAARLVVKFTRPPEHSPSFLKPTLLVEGIRERWDIDPSWLDTIIGHQGESWSKVAEDILLGELQRIGPAAAVRLLPSLMHYYLSDRDDSLRRIHIYRSRVRTWLLQNISLADATLCLTDLQLETLWQAPHTLPPHLLLGMLQAPDEVEPAWLPARTHAIRVLGADQVDTLSRLLGTESLSMIAAERLWAVAPEIAERLLDTTPQDGEPLAMRSLILSAPLERTGPAARAILSRPETIAESERRDWAKRRLPVGGAHAEMLGQILHLKMHEQPSADEVRRTGDTQQAGVAS